MKEKPKETDNVLDYEIDVTEIKSRSVKGVAALVSRTFLAQLITLIATLALTIFLDPSVYGIFFLVSAVVNFLAYFSDIGLAAALVQKKERLSKEDLATTFTIQQILVILLVAVLFAATPLIRSNFNLSSAGVFLLWSMAIAFFLSSLKTIPTITLERSLQFNKLVVPQIAETIVFNATAVFFAWRGLGITAFTLAVLARGIIGLILIYIIAPWRPQIRIYRSSLSSLLKFGLPYQANTFLAVFKDDGMTVILGKIIGAEGLGFLGWASRWANLPLRIFMDNVTKVAFPAFSRLQHDKEKLARAIELSLKYLALSTFPILLGMGFMATPLVHIIPRYLKWAPAIVPLYIYLYNAAWACVSTSLTNTLNALGRIKTTFKLMVMWTSLTWLLMPALAILKGYMGVAFAVGIIATTSIITVIAVRRHVAFSLISSFKTPILASFALAIFLALTGRLVSNIPTLAIIGTTSALIYFLLIFALEGKEFIRETISYFKPSHA